MIDLHALNPAQREAVENVQSPTLVLAGAGSGKTRVLIYKIARLVSGGMKPWRILAVTFTNKAAREMSSRAENLLNLPVQNLWIGTFHSICVRILRREAENWGFRRDFTIYDDDDRLSVIKKTLKDTHAVFGGELSGHFYYRDNFFADSGMITMVHILNILSATDKPLSELVKPLCRYSTGGEANYEVDDKQAVMDMLAEKYHQGNIDLLDGVTVQFDDWWFNCRPSNTEPLLRLNVEAKTDDILAEKLAELKTILGKPVAR